MTDREAIQKALDTPHRRYSIKPHGNGYAIYRDRDLFHHGFNLGYLTEVTPETIELIENALNTTLAQPKQEPVCTKIEGNQFETFKVRYEDAVKLKDLPVGTKLYTAPPSKQEPVAWLEYDDEGYLFLSGKRKGAFPVFIAPSSKPFVFLTKEDMPSGNHPMYDTKEFYAGMAWAQTKLKEKNA